MEAEILRPTFGATAQSRDSSIVPIIKDKSEAVAMMARYHAEIKAKHGWLSTTTKKPHRFLILSHMEEHGICPVARCSIETSQNSIVEINNCGQEDFLAVLRLDEPFETQWPKDRAQDTVADLIANPIDTRFKRDAEVVLKFQPMTRD